ncbi:organic cation transporter protein-like [Physella acuta]|uniref:organic cation transporter protein-like n=1 Tax=Physella acuta TaxID=109671 RepID=UPI0027DE2C8C|nr:organic cation transporter protein-like [Physella acuta]
MHFDDLMKLLGEFGLYQRVRFFLICLFSIVSAWHAFNMVFIGATPSFHCDVSSYNLSGTPLENLSLPERNSLLLPPKSSCRQFDVLSLLNGSLAEFTGHDASPVALYSNTSRRQIECQHGYQYSKEEYSSTLTSEFDLVCDRKFWIPTSKSVFFAGRLCGAFVFGQLSDRFGRRPMFFVGCLLLLVAGTIASLAPNIFVFLPMYFCQGAAHTGAFLVAYTLSTELVGPRYRVVAGFVSQGFYSIGYITLAGLAYFIREWRYLEMTITLPVLLFGFYWWFLPESIRWQMSHGREAQAEETIRRAARQNGVTLGSDVFKTLQDDPSLKAGRQYYILDCVRTWKMAKLSFNIWFNWFVNALVYYGLSLNTENLAGNPYMNFCLAGAVEIPAYVICILILNKVGRRWPLILSMYIGGVACILSGCLPTEESSTIETVSVVLAMLGKFGITASYAIIYLMAAELFPTVIRNIGMGVASMSARIGGILAPVFLDLQTISKPFPLIVFGSLSLLAGSLAILLPETAGKPLPQLPEDVDTSETCTDALCCRGKEKYKLDTELQQKI